MNYEYLLIEKKEKVGIITLNRPPENRLTVPLMHEVKSALEEQGFKVIGEFSCLGFDTALSSEGINKGRPNNQDIAEAEEFIFSIIKNNQ